MFESNFFVILLPVSMLMITSSGIELSKPDETTGCSNNNTRYLIRAQNGMKYYMENDTFGRVNVTYDCSLDNSYKGVIDLEDEEHPSKIDSMFIKNCLNLTVHITTCVKQVKSLQITGVQEVKIYSKYENQPLDVVITDVEILEWPIDREGFFNYHRCFNKKNASSLILKNLALKNFNDKSFDSLYMTGVIAKRFKADELSCSQLTIKNCSFSPFETRSLFGSVRQVYIVNTTFEAIFPNSFNLQVNESFVFSDNHVEKVLDAIRVAGPKVEIIGNTIDAANSSVFIIHSAPPDLDENIIISVNVSSNTIKSLKNNLVELTDDSEPHLLTIERNHFYCSCKTGLYLEKLVKSSSGNIMTKLLLDNHTNNVCVNFGNCPLRKLLGEDISLCLNTFVCPEDYPDVASEKGIASELKNLTEALHLFMEHHKNLKYLDNTSTENYKTVNANINGTQIFDSGSI